MSKEQMDREAIREGECGQCKWINGHRSWCNQYSLTNTEEARTEFLKAVAAFRSAGLALCNVWADADEVAPLPDSLKPPMSLDEWLDGFAAFYEVALAESDASSPDWEVDGDPCNDCGEPAAYDEANGWYFHIDPAAPACFLMGSGPIEGSSNDPLERQSLQAERDSLISRIHASEGPRPELSERLAALDARNTRRGPAAGHDPKKVNEMISAEKANPKFARTGPDAAWREADKNLDTLEVASIYDGSGCREIHLQGDKVYALLDWDGEYRVGLYFTEADQATGEEDEGGVCATFADWASCEAFVLRLANVGIQKEA